MTGPRCRAWNPVRPSCHRPLVLLAQSHFDVAIGQADSRTEVPPFRRFPVFSLSICRFLRPSCLCPKGGTWHCKSQRNRSNWIKNGVNLDHGPQERQRAGCSAAPLPRSPSGPPPGATTPWSQPPSGHVHSAYRFSGETRQLAGTVCFPVGYPLTKGLTL